MKFLSKIKTTLKTFFFLGGFLFALNLFPVVVLVNNFVFNFASGGENLSISRPQRTK